MTPIVFKLRLFLCNFIQMVLILVILGLVILRVQ